MPLVLGSTITKSHIYLIICCFLEQILLHFFKKFHFKQRSCWFTAQSSKRETEILNSCLFDLWSSRWLYHCKTWSRKAGSSRLSMCQHKSSRKFGFFSGMHWFHCSRFVLLSIFVLIFLQPWKRKMKIKRNIPKYSCMTKSRTSMPFPSQHHPPSAATCSVKQQGGESL